MMELNGKSYIIVAGGGESESRMVKKFTKPGNTVEILDTSSPNEGWIQGKHKYTCIS